MAGTSLVTLVYHLGRMLIACLWGCWGTKKIGSFKNLWYIVSLISSFSHVPHPTHQHVFLVLPLYHIQNHHLYHCHQSTTLSPSGHITSHLDSYRSRWVSYFYLSFPIFYFPCSSSQSASFKIHLITSVFCSYPSIDFSFAQSEIPSFYCGLWPYLHLLSLHWWPLPCFRTLNVHLPWGLCTYCLPCLYHSSTGYLHGSQSHVFQVCV